MVDNASDQTNSGGTYIRGNVDTKGGDFVGRDKIGNGVIATIINTGDHNQFFIGDYERLRDAFIQPWSVFQRVKVDRFAGREWLTAEINAFLRNEDRGYFILEAGAGLGKSTFLAHLVKKNGYIHHFVEQAPRSTGIAIGLRNLAAQLVRAWQLNPYSAEGAFSGAATRPDFFQNLLFDAAQKRDEVRPGEKIVIVVDALDEVGTPPGQNVLGLPSILPAGVYFIVSQRPVQVPLRVEGPRRTFSLTAESETNLTDMRIYLETAATWPGVAHALAEGHGDLASSPYTPAEFVTTLLHKCRGHWLYLHYVVDEIEHGKRKPLDLGSLPDGIWQYYTQFWNYWRDQDRTIWYNERLPLLSTLAAVQEDLPLAQLCKLAGIPGRSDQSLLGDLLGEQWRPFLAVDKRGDSKWYGLYHASLREFFDGRIDWAQLKVSDRNLAEELAHATRQSHSRIADRYLDAWGGLRNRLPALQDLGQPDLDSQYGIRHLVAHLAGANRLQDLHNLLTIEWMHSLKISVSRQGLPGWWDHFIHKQHYRTVERYENAWHQTRERIGQVDGYLADVMRAWQLAEDTFAAQQSALAISLQCRYALITASLNSLAETIPSDLLAALVTENVWPHSQGLAFIRQIPDRRQRVESLMKLASCLPLPHLAEALSIARAVDDEEYRAQAVVSLAPHLPKELFTEALSIVRTIVYDKYRAQALIGLAPYLSEALFSEALAIVKTIRIERHREHALALLAPYLPATLLNEAQSAARMIEDHQYQVQALVALALCLSETARIPLLREALTVACGIGHEGIRAQALSYVAPHLPAALQTDALAATQSIKDENYRVAALTEVASHLPEIEQVPLFFEILMVTRTILEKKHNLEERGRSQVLANCNQALVKLALGLAKQNALAPMQPSPLAMSTWTMIDEKQRAQILIALALYLPTALTGLIPNLPEALAAVRTISDEDTHIKALIGLAPHLSLEQVRDVFTDSSEAVRTKALIGLAPHLSLEQVREALTIARTIDNIEHRIEALKSLEKHLPEIDRGSIAQELAKLQPHTISYEFDERSYFYAKEEWKQYESEQKEALVEFVIGLARLNCLNPALTVVQAIKNQEDRTQALIQLAPLLQDQSLTEALAITRQIGDAKYRARTLAAFVVRLPQNEQEPVLREALATTQAIGARLSLNLPEADQVCAEVLAALAAHLPANLLPAALAIVHMIAFGENRAMALVALAPHLPLERRSEVLSLVEAIANENIRAKVLVDLAPYPSTELLNQAFAIAHTMSDKRSRLQALVGLALRLQQQTERAPVLREALAAEREIGDERRQEQTVAELTIAVATLDHAKDAYKMVQAIKHEEIRLQTLIVLAPYLPKELLTATLTTVRAIEVGKTRGEMLVRLAPYLPDELLPEMLNITKTIDIEEIRTVLLGLTPYLRRAKLLSEALQIAKAIGKEGVRAEALLELTPHLPVELLSDVLHATKAIRDEEVRAYVLSGLAPHLPPELFDTAQIIARTIELYWIREPLLSELAARLSKAKQKADPEDVQATVERVRGNLSWEQELASAQLIGDVRERDQALIKFVQELAAHEPLEAQGIANTIEDAKCRDQALIAVVLGFAKLQRLAQARANLQEILSEEYRAAALVGLLPLLSSTEKETILAEALSAVQAIKDERFRTRALTQLAVYLSTEQLTDILAAVQVALSEDIRAQALVELAPHLSPEQLVKSLQMAQAMNDRRNRTPALTALSRHLAQLPLTMLRPCWNQALHSSATHDRNELLLDLEMLTPVIKALGGADALQETVGAIRDVGRWWP